MNGEKFNIPPRKRRILVAPLEWGLGHATRCIPLINALEDQHCEVYIAAEGATHALLREEFPSLNFLPLMGYRMRYSRKKIFLPWKIISQFPRILFTIYREYAWLQKVIKEFSLDAVISDNRFGLHTTKIPCIYITHQLWIKTGNTFTEKIANKIHHHFIKKYTECWVPDFAGSPSAPESGGLAGDLSHPKKPLLQAKYIGPLSRFYPQPAEKKYDLLIVISGPEPQRSVFEKTILDELKGYAGSCLFIRGLPENTASIAGQENITIKNHLAAKELNGAILQSGMVISRCGYTTVMDLVKLQKKAILVPTPGQTEQEYLAGYLLRNKIFYTVSQENFNLTDCLEEASDFSYSFPEGNMDQYQDVIRQFVQSS